MQRIGLLSAAELTELLDQPLGASYSNPADLQAFCARLHDHLQALYPEFLAATQLETGFTASDCDELVHSTIGYVKGFPDHCSRLQTLDPPAYVYKDGQADRSIQLAAVPWGTIVAILPQSAFLILAITCIVNALCEGNRIIIRAPVQSARSAALLATAVEAASDGRSGVSILLSPARSFLDAVCASKTPGLVHYLGSSGHATDIMTKCFEAGMHCIVDGEGNTWVYVDEDVDPEYAAQNLTNGAIRYNGETCTSINGAVIHPSIYNRIRDLLAERWKTLTYGNPLTSDVQVGPVLDAGQADFILDRIAGSGATILSGGTADGNLVAPTLTTEPLPDSQLVTDGIFGPALWITPGSFCDFTRMWPTNRYQLCAGILSNRLEPREIALQLPNAARITINGDPSIEDIYEPWGGYPATGNNPVSHWPAKYRRTVQLDRLV